MFNCDVNLQKFQNFIYLLCRLHKLVTSRQQDKLNLAAIEKKLAEEKKARAVVEQQLVSEKKSKSAEAAAAARAMALATATR